MSADNYEVVLNRFISDLNHAWYAAGTPSYSRIEQRSGKLRSCSGQVKLDVLARSTTQEILSGQRAQPPKWQWVVSFVTVMQAMAQDGGIPAERIGTIEEWKLRHEAVRAAKLASKRPAGVGGRHRKPAVNEDADSVASTSDLVPPQRDGVQSQAGDSKAVPRDEVLSLLPQEPGLRWWDRYRDIAPEWRGCFLALESQARLIRTYEPRVIPGLLQIEAYARTILELDRPNASADEIACLADLHRGSQDLLSRLSSFHLWAIFDETTLRTGHASRQTMRSQITHLINVSEQPNVTIQVLRAAGLNDHVAIREPITIFRFPDQRDDVVFLEQPESPVFLTVRSETEHYSQLMSRLAMRATRADEARGLLTEIFTEI